MYSKFLTGLNTLVIMLLPFMKYVQYNNSPINISLADSLLIIMGLIVLFNLKLLFTKENKWIPLYFIGLILSLVISQVAGNMNTDILTASNKTLLVEILKTTIIGLYFVFAFIYTRNTKYFNTALLTISFSAIPVLIIGYTSSIQFIIHKDPTFEAFKTTYRFIGTFKDPNLCAFFLCMIIFVTLYNHDITKNKFLKILLLVILYFSIIATFLTMSRGGLIALFVGIIMFLFLKRQNIKKQLLLYLLPFLVLGVTFFFVDQTFQEGKMTTYMSNRLNQTMATDVTDINRVQLSTAAIKMGNDNIPFGVGKGSFPLNSYKYLGLDNTYYKVKSIPHNTLASFYAQQGIVGLSIFLSLLIYIFILMFKNRKPYHDYIFSLSLCWLIQSLTINTENIRFFWYFFGLILAHELMNKRSRLNENPIK